MQFSSSWYPSSTFLPPGIFCCLFLLLTVKQVLYETNLHCIRQLGHPYVKIIYSVESEIGFVCKPIWIFGALWLLPQVAYFSVLFFIGPETCWCQQQAWPMGDQEELPCQGKPVCKKQYPGCVKDVNVVEAVHWCGVVWPFFPCVWSSLLNGWVEEVTVLNRLYWAKAKPCARYTRHSIFFLTMSLSQTSTICVCNTTSRSMTVKTSILIGWNVCRFLFYSLLLLQSVTISTFVD